MENDNFDEAYQELTDILESLQQDGVSIDCLTSKVKRAKELISYCKVEIRTIEGEIINSNN